MYEFLDRFITICTPRIRDFHGLAPNGFDGKGNYNLGLKEQYMFPEINMDKSDKPRGMNITFVTTTQDDARARELLDNLGLSKRLTHRPNQLSGGEQQRAAIARALINHPPLLFGELEVHVCP